MASIRYTNEIPYGQLASDAGMHAGVAHQLLLVSHVEKRPVGDARLVSDSTGVSWPGVQMGIEVYDGDWAVYFVERTKDREYDCVIAS